MTTMVTRVQPSVSELLQRARECLAAADNKAAHEACLAVLKLDTKNVDAHYLLAMNALSRGEVVKAKTLLQVAHKMAPEDIPVNIQLSRCFSLLSDNTASKSLLQAIEFDDLTTASSLDTVGVLWSRLGDHERANQYFSAALEKEPNNADYLFNLGSNERFMGQLEQSLAHLKQALRIVPGYHKAYSLIPELRKASPDDNIIEHIHTVLEDKKHNPDVFLHCCHGLSREYEALGDSDNMMAWLSEGKAQKKTHLGYCFEQDAAIFDSMERVTKAVISHRQSLSVEVQDNARHPIFILGMPRSGTTLLERILSNHSQVKAVGELQDFPIALKKLSATSSPLVLDEATIEKAADVDIEALGELYSQRAEVFAEGSEYYIDKMPLNFLYAGLISCALPNAKIICMRRNPMDVCFSNYKQLFATDFSFYNYAYDLEDCARYLVRFDKLMKTWKTLLPEDRYVELDYEDLVDNTEARSREMLAFCGLNWQSSCMDFSRNRAPVATASAVQVRKPIYRSSIQKWKKYEKYLLPAMRIFDTAGIQY